MRLARQPDSLRSVTKFVDLQLVGRDSLPGEIDQSGVVRQEQHLGLRGEFGQHSEG